MKWQKVCIGLIRIIFIVAVMRSGLNFHKQYLLLSGLLLTFIPEFVTKLTQIIIPPNGQLCLAIFVLGCQYLGSYLKFYGLISWWDMMLHTVSGGILGYWLLIYCYAVSPELILKGTRKERGAVVLIGSFLVVGSIAGAGAWEILEFLGDTFLGMNAQLGSLKDTMTDIICGTIGGGLYAAYIVWRLMKEKNNPVMQLLIRNDISGQVADKNSKT